MTHWNKRLIGIGLSAALVLSAAGLSHALPAQAEEAVKTEAVKTEASKTEASKTEEASKTDQAADTAAETEDSGEVYILYTSDVHCGVDQGFGYAGLQQVRQNLESQGCTTILVDNGDAIRGEMLGAVTKGEAIIDLMNKMEYDVAIPGNHEFDYGVEHFLELTEKAEFPYISCNFMKGEEPVFDPYTMIEAQGMKIAFVGVCTPQSLTSSTPKYFQDKDGNYIYGFLQDKTGKGVYDAVQAAVDSAREDGADYVYVMGHLGMDESASPWTYADVISHTNGIDVFLDGHSHDTEQVVMKNKDGQNVTRSACGTKMACIGYSHLNKEKGVVETGIWSWPNKVSAPELLGIDNEISQEIESMKADLEGQLGEPVGKSEVELTIYDPVETYTDGQPVQMVRRAETNMGDFCADAIRTQMGADISLVNGGGIRTEIHKGTVTYGNVIDVMPFHNEICMIEATGQQIVDALEWGARSMPDASGGFLQVSGLSYTIDVNQESVCIRNDEGMFSGFDGDSRRVTDVMVDGKPIDLEKTYTVASTDYLLLNNGDGHTSFDGCKTIPGNTRLDVDVLISYITDNLEGTIGGEYADPFGEGRITIID